MKANGNLAIEFKGDGLHPTSELCNSFYFDVRFLVLFLSKRLKTQVNKSSN